MSLIVKKFGGSSVADGDKLHNAAKIIANSKDGGNQIVVIVSAQGDTTDDLLARASELNPKANRREMDMLLSCGEQMSASLLAMTLEKMGHRAISLTGWQAGMKTDSNYSSAKIKEIDTERVLRELNRGNIVIIAGFQGINRFGDVTTIGRGGSDTTAVAFAAALKADLCKIYTDVDGVYTADPRIVKNAKKLDEINYDEMLELASLGAQVLASRSVEMAKKFRVTLEVLSSFKNIPGTKVLEVSKMENTQVSGVARDNDVARVALIGLQDQPGVAAKVFTLLAQNKINVDIILQSINRDDATTDISFTIVKSQLPAARSLFEERKDTLRYENIKTSDQVSKISIVGAGMVHNPGVAARMFEALSQAGINIQMISTSEIKISVLVSLADSDRAINVVHQEFFK